MDVEYSSDVFKFYFLLPLRFFTSVLLRRLSLNMSCLPYELNGHIIITDFVVAGKCRLSNHSICCFIPACLPQFFTKIFQFRCLRCLVFLRIQGPDYKLRNIKNIMRFVKYFYGTPLQPVPARSSNIKKDAQGIEMLLIKTQVSD